jgi:5-methylcytosine-specific restriction endonuclease McrA
VAKHLGYGGWINDDPIAFSMEYAHRLAVRALDNETMGFLFRVIMWTHTGCADSFSTKKDGWCRLLACGPDEFDRCLAELIEGGLVSRANEPNEHIRLTPADWTQQTQARQASWSKVNYAAAYERDGNRCRYCGSIERLSIDHVRPRVQGGSDDLENLAVACRPCNSRKNGRTPEQAGMALRPLLKLVREGV